MKKKQYELHYGIKGEEGEFAIKHRDMDEFELLSDAEQAARALALDMFLENFPDRVKVEDVRISYIIDNRLFPAEWVDDNGDLLLDITEEDILALSVGEDDEIFIQELYDAEIEFFLDYSASLIHPILKERIDKRLDKAAAEQQSKNYVIPEPAEEKN